MPHQRSTSTTAKLLYRPVRLASGILSGAIAGLLFKQLWKLATSPHEGHPEGARIRFRCGDPPRRRTAGRDLRDGQGARGPRQHPRFERPSANGPATDPCD